MIAAEPGDVAGSHVDVPEATAPGDVLASVPLDRDADNAVSALYASHYRPLVRLAALLVCDQAAAEEVVQESFVAMHCHWRGIRDQRRALSYLRKSVVKRSRSVVRLRAAADIAARQAPADAQGPARGTGDALGTEGASAQHSAVIAALGGLAAQQREALVLRYYEDLSEAQIASAMGISKGAVRRHLARAWSALHVGLEWLT